MTGSSPDPLAPGPRRVALVLADVDARRGAPPGIDPDLFAAACLADSYEVVADLVGVTAGIVGDGPEVAALLWPGSRQVAAAPVRQLLAALEHDFDEVVLVPADVPDLPGLVLAKVFRALQRADVCVAPERGPGGGCVAVGVRLPWPTWITLDLDLDHDPLPELVVAAPGRGRAVSAPSWHRMRTPAAVQRLDPGLEGWEMTRSLLSGHSLGQPGARDPAEGRDGAL